MKRKILIAATLFALAAPAHAVTLRWAAQNDILTLDPHSQNHATTISIMQHCYEPLVRYDKKFQVEPALAASWEQVTPTQWRFKLRQNVKFHDGSPFTADDVVFSYARIKQPQGTMQPYVTGVKDVTKVDDHTVDFILEGPNPVFLRNLVVFHIMSKTWAEKNKSEKVQDYKANENTFASRNTNGTGAYMIKSWEPDKQVTMVANPNWWDKREGNATEVIYSPIKSDATRVAALLADNVDLVTDLPTQDVERLKKESKLKVLDGAENRTIFIALDQGSDELKYADVKGKNPFKDVRVRRALQEQHRGTGADMGLDAIDDFFCHDPSPLLERSQKRPLRFRAHCRPPRDFVHRTQTTRAAVAGDQYTDFDAWRWRAFNHDVQPTRSALNYGGSSPILQTAHRGD